jgi:hypothetical protein
MKKKILFIRTHNAIHGSSGFTGTEEEVRAVFRKVRDEIIYWIDAKFGEPYA